MCPLWQTCNQVTDFTYTNINFSVKQTQIKVNNIVIYSWCFAHPCTTCTCGQVVVVAITQVTNIANFFTQQAPNKKHNLFSFLFFKGWPPFLQLSSTHCIIRKSFRTPENWLQDTLATASSWLGCVSPFCCVAGSYTSTCVKKSDQKKENNANNSIGKKERKSVLVYQKL